MVHILKIQIVGKFTKIKDSQIQKKTKKPSDKLTAFSNKNLKTKYYLF